jgi:hypothetical protein
MKLRHFLLPILVVSVSYCGFAQVPYSSDHLRATELRLPAQYIGDTLRIALGRYLPTKVHHAVVVSVRLPHDSIYYRLPSTLPTGDSFAVKVLVDQRNHQDTLLIVKRTERTSVVRFEAIRIVAFQNPRKFQLGRYSKGLQNHLARQLTTSVAVPNRRILLTD